MIRRKDNDNRVIHFQMDRFVQQNGEWFYMTREGVQRGPFISKANAEDDMHSYVHHVRNMEKYGQYA